MRTITLAAALIGAGLAAAAAQDAAAPDAASQPPATAQDPSSAPAAVRALDAATFVTRAMAANAFEIDSSRLAELNAGSDAVKAFARRMIADHGDAGSKLARIATHNSLAPPEETGSVGEDPLKAAMDRLAGLTGEAFDRAYVEAQLVAHDDAIRLFTAYAESGDDARLRDFAVSTLPKLQEHQADLMEITP